METVSFRDLAIFLTFPGKSNRRAFLRTDWKDHVGSIPIASVYEGRVSHRRSNFISSSRKASAGVRYPGHLRGVALRRLPIDLIYRFGSDSRAVSRGRYRRTRLFMFSTEPFCHALPGRVSRSDVPRGALADRRTTLWCPCLCATRARM